MVNDMVGNWISTSEGLALVTQVVQEYYEVYEDIPKGMHVGEASYRYVIFKPFSTVCDKVRKKYRMSCERMDYITPISKKEQQVLDGLIAEYPREYQRFMVFNGDVELRVFAYLWFPVDLSNEEANSLLKLTFDALNNTEFTFSSFLQCANSLGLSLTTENVLAPECRFSIGNRYDGVRVALHFKRGAIEHRQRIFHRGSFEIIPVKVSSRVIEYRLPNDMPLSKLDMQMSVLKANLSGTNFSFSQLCLRAQNVGIPVQMDNYWDDGDIWSGNALIISLRAHGKQTANISDNLYFDFDYMIIPAH